ncbi:unannotated protein [freshwater metagenome]|uniref:Unannotated protein n=1 Tax=freshwater metagenome TaxID=449393 RepID=A0A6J6GH41_9ZZZZ
MCHGRGRDGGRGCGRRDGPANLSHLVRIGHVRIGHVRIGVVVRTRKLQVAGLGGLRHDRREHLREHRVHRVRRDVRRPEGVGRPGRRGRRDDGRRDRRGRCDGSGRSGIGDGSRTRGDRRERLEQRPGAVVGLRRQMGRSGRRGRRRCGTRAPPSPLVGLGLRDETGERVLHRLVVERDGHLDAEVAGEEPADATAADPVGGHHAHPSSEGVFGERDRLLERGSTEPHRVRVVVDAGRTRRRRRCGRCRRTGGTRTRVSLDVTGRRRHRSPPGWSRTGSAWSSG